MDVVNKTLAPKHIPFCEPGVVLPGAVGKISDEALKANKRFAATIDGDLASGELEEAVTEKAEAKPKVDPKTGKPAA